MLFLEAHRLEAVEIDSEGGEKEEVQPRKENLRFVIFNGVRIAESLPGAYSQETEVWHIHNHSGKVLQPTRKHTRRFCMGRRAGNHTSGPRFPIGPYFDSGSFNPKRKNRTEAEDTSNKRQRMLDTDAQSKSSNGGSAGGSNQSGATVRGNGDHIRSDSENIDEEPAHERSHGGANWHGEHAHGRSNGGADWRGAWS